MKDEGYYFFIDKISQMFSFYKRLFGSLADGFLFI